MSIPADPRRLAQAHAAVCEALRLGSEVMLVITSASMSPLLQPGDAVVVSPAERQIVHPGDLVLLEAGGSLITHRVLQVGKDFLQTKGDAVFKADTLVQRTQVIGVIQKIERGSLEISLDQPVWQRVSRLTARIGRAEDRLWKTLHPDELSGSLRNLMDVINWILRIPLRGVTLAAVHYTLWIESL